MLLNMRSKIVLFAIMLICVMSVSSCTNNKVVDVENTNTNTNTNTVNTFDESKKIESVKLENNNIVKNDNPETKVKELVENMTLEEKIGQMFIVAPEVFSSITVTKIDELDTEKMKKYNIGGVIMFGQNIVEPTQITSLNTALKGVNEKYPMFIAVDEEGGQVARIANNSNFTVKKFANMSETGKQASNYTPEQIGLVIGDYLKTYGFNLNFAPVCDVLLNNENTVVKSRSFSSDPNVVASMAVDVMKGLRSNDILAAAKHFPGHGNTALDTHDGFATSDATLEAMKSNELIPFAKMIDENVDFMMISHVIYPNVSKNEVPATMNKDIIDILKNDMGYKGVVITDGMNMGAIANNYTSADSTVEAVKAGVDVVLMPQDFYKSYEALLNAVKNGEISEAQINESVEKILKLKIKA